MPKTILLESEQTIYQARVTHGIFFEALKDTEEIAIDLALIQEVDSSFLQNLLWLKNEGQRLNINIKLYNPTVILIDAANALGLSNSLIFDGEL